MKLLKRKFRTNTYEEVRAGSEVDLIEIMHRFNDEISVIDYEDLKSLVEEYNDCNDVNFSLVEYFNSFDREKTGSSYINREIDEVDIEKLKAGKAIILFCLANSGESSYAFVEDKENEKEIINALNDIFYNLYDSEYRLLED